jgi:hypothetical protein
MKLIIVKKRKFQATISADSERNEESRPKSKKARTDSDDDEG